MKGIGRRKSGTPEPVNNPKPPSVGFRVIPREEVVRKSLGGLDRPPMPLDHRRTWSEEESSSNRCVQPLWMATRWTNRHRGSGSSAATSNSRLSDRPVPPPTTVPPPPPPDRYKRLSALPPHPDRPAPAAPREAQASRLNGESSGSQGYLDLPGEQAEGSFSDMFKGLGLRKSMTFDGSYASQPPPAVAKKVGSVSALYVADNCRTRSLTWPLPTLRGASRPKRRHPL